MPSDHKWVDVCRKHLLPPQGYTGANRHHFPSADVPSDPQPAPSGFFPRFHISPFRLGNSPGDRFPNKICTGRRGRPRFASVLKHQGSFIKG